MRFLRVIRHRFRSLFLRSTAEADLHKELDIHLEQLMKEHMSAGMNAVDAKRAARREFGSLELMEEQCRDARAVRLVEDFVKDLRYALRLLKRSPAFSVTAVLSLALGIGANTALFSLVDAVLLRMLPVREPQQLAEMTQPGGGTLSYPIFEAIRDRNQVFSGVLLLSGGRMAASAHLGSADLGEIHLSPVSGNYFEILGVLPVIGRALTEEDLDASNVAVISYGFWQRVFAGNPAVLGKILQVGADSHPYTVVGVAPKGFTGVAVGQPIDLWIPVARSRNPVAFMFRVIARRKPGVSEAVANANVQLLARQLSKEWGFEQPLQIEVTGAGSGLTGMRRRFALPFLVLTFISLLLLLMVTLNIAHLLLARASARQREIGVRLSLGASHSRLLRQLLTESFVLGCAGSVLGLFLAPVAAKFLVRFLSSSTGAMELPFAIDVRLLAFTTCVSVAVVLLFGLAPALATTRRNLTPISSGSLRITSGLGLVRRGKFLVTAQVAISCVLLAGAVLFGRSLQTLANVDAGFNGENVLILHLGTAAEGPFGADRVRLYGRVLQGLATVPGVRSAAMSSEPLFGGGTWTEAVSAPGFTPQRGVNRESVLLALSPGFFQTMNIPLTRGRDFQWRDNETAPKIAVVNEAMARFYFGTADPLGRTFRLESSGFPLSLTVVGVVRNAKYRSLKETATRIIYLPALQMLGPFGGGTNIAVRTAGNPEKMVHSLWNTARSESPYLRFEGSTTQMQLVNGTIAQDRMLAELSVFFGLSAAVLVCLGLYGLTAYQVSRRTAEIGLRIALGAQPHDVLRMVLKGAMTPIAAGSAFGLCLTLALMRLVEGLLFGMRPVSALTLLITLAILVSIGMAAAYWPARRAAALDPQKTLRYE